MKKTLDLFNEIKNTCFENPDMETKLWIMEEIDRSLDDELGIDNRTDLETELIPDDVYQTILYSFIQDKEYSIHM